jgi:haloalkane dehalogenase
MKKRRQEVLGVSMAYVEHGQGDPIVLVHGNPTSSYLWRKVIPELSRTGRCIAPDLIGMGDSAKVFRGPHTYTFLDHQAYLEAFLDAKGIVADVTLVGHDWGGPLVFDWGRRHADSVKAVVYMETMVTPMSWDDWPETATRFFQALRSEAGEEMILEKNLFVERILPASVLDPMPDDVLEVYRGPYRQVGESRRPTLSWPREIPFDAEPPNVAAIVEANESWLQGPHVPKLFINAEPGSILVGRQREVCRSWANQSEVSVRGLHFIQEDSGEEIGRAIASWLGSI